MKLIEQIYDRVNEQFINAKLPKTGIKAPRTGYYFIKSVEFQPVGQSGQVLIAEANWKESLQGYFADDLVIKVAISNLMFDNIEHPPLTDDHQLIGKTLYIYNPVFDVKYFDGKPQQVIKALCHYVDEPAKFINQSNAALLSIPIDGNKSIYQSLVESAPYNLEEALYWESGQGYGDDYSDDPEQDVVYDA